MTTRLTPLNEIGDGSQSCAGGQPLDHVRLVHRAITTTVCKTIRQDPVSGVATKLARGDSNSRAPGFWGPHPDLAQGTGASGPRHGCSPIEDRR